MDDQLDIHRFDLDSQGLARVVGELQARILEVVWQRQSATVRDVTAALDPDAHPKTVMTIMNRMVDKGLLRRERHGRAFVYRAVADRATFIERIVQRVLAGLLRDFPAPTLAHFIESTDETQLAELEALLRKRRSD